MSSAEEGGRERGREGWREGAREADRDGGSEVGEKKFCTGAHFKTEAKGSSDQVN